MEELFVSEYELSDGVLREHVNRNMRMRFLLVAALGVGLMVQSIYFILVSFAYLGQGMGAGSSFSIWTFCFIIGGVLVVEGFRIRRKNYKAMVTRYTEQYGGIDLPVRVAVGKERVIRQIGTDRTELSFRDLKKVMVSKHYVMFVFHGNLYAAVKKDGFTVGTYEAFREFAERKKLLIKPVKRRKLF